MSDPDTLDRFEALVLSQKPADKPWTPTEAVPYDFESRKLAEGIHPQLIKGVFQPSSVLDVGCGPGHLVAMLGKLGVDVQGMDRNLEPWGGPRCHFWVGDITQKSSVKWPRGYDLVICREVLEHLTVREIRHAVTNLCALSSRFVYTTTRYSSESDVFHVDTSDNLDPTHISLCAKDFIRLLFVLEGFKRRADLEERMDHQRKGRCLVYERVA